ncbi:TonB-dependent receptor [Sphingomonas kaistensis]|uniref:TonB-dependent receptor n=1 Tax=Sphingomonas kaistensis TaxID=298708 RepID=A0ABZ2G3L4_9SPHN
MFQLSLAAAFAATTSPTVIATTEAAALAQPAPRGSDHDAAQNQDIVVTGIRRNRQDVLGGISVVSGEELQRDLRSTIGETLIRQPGVSATSFGPNASRPILRGLGGERVRVLTDGIGSLDVSTSSVDHAVAINPLTADRIEVLRGPAALLFGSSAIGGVVNVIDSRIPRAMPESPLHIDALGTLGSAADERSANARVDVPIGQHLVLHADGSIFKSDDVRTGGYILSPALRAEARASSDADIRALADLKGDLPNSAAKSSEIAGGVAYIDGRFNIGASIARFDNLYGAPVRYSLDPATEAEEVRLDQKQTRYDVRAEIPVDGFIDEVKVRGGAVRYRHDELEETGEIGTTFRSRGEEGRIEAVQRTINGWGGGFGAQYLDRRVNVVGEEKYLPANQQKQFGLFTLQNYETGPYRVEVGARVERSNLMAEADADLGNPALERKFTSLAGSIGGSVAVASSTRAGLNLSYSERAPSTDELFANGPHAGTQAFEIGNPDFGKEKSLSIEATLRRSAGPLTFGLNLYHTRFTDFIYLQPTGEVEDDLPVYLYSQADARFTGFELEGRASLGTFGGVELAADAQADYVRATVKGFGPAPQIPPLRLLGGVDARAGAIDGRLEIEHSFAQKRNAPIETDTAAFTLVNASVNWRPLQERPDLTLGLQANNIFDVEARRHTSLLKDYAPIAGRDFRLTARLAF